MSIVVEKAVPADAAALLAHLKQVGGETDNLTFGAEGLPFTVEAEEAFLARQQNSRDSVMFLAKENGEIIGNASLSRQPRRMSHRGDLTVSVVRSHWNRGVGSRLMQELIAFARENDFEIIDLQVLSENLPAIHLYEKFGFERLCTYPAFFRIGDRCYDAEFMCLHLK